MAALTSLLVRDQLVPVRKIEEALQRQVVSGGTIETVLLEMGLVREDVLSAYRAALFGLLPATREEILRAPRATLQLVGPELATSLRVVPLSSDGRILVLAAEAPLTTDTLAALEQATGHRVTVRITHEARLQAALAHHFGLSLDARFARLNDKLRRADPGTVPYVKLPADVVTRARASTFDQPDAVQVQRRTAQDSSAANVPAAGDERRGSAELVTPAVARACRGPLGEERVREILATCENREDVLFVILRYLAQFFEYSAVFRARGAALRGRANRGSALSDEAFRKLEVPLSGSGLLARAARDRRATVGSLGQDEEERQATAAMLRPASTLGLAVPVVVVNRVALLLYADRAGEVVDSEDAEPVVRLATRVAETIRRLILADKALRSASPSLPAGPESRNPPDTAPREPEGGDDPKGADARVQSGPGAAGTRRAEPSLRPPLSKAELEVDAALDADMRSESPEELATRAHASGPDAHPASDGADSRQVRASLGVPRQAPNPPSLESKPPGYRHLEQPPSRVDEELWEQGEQDSSVRISIKTSRVPVTDAPPIPRFSQAPLREQSQDARHRAEPSVVVNMGAELTRLVEELAAEAHGPPETDPPQVARLLAIGEAALPLLIQAFPGQLWHDRHGEVASLPAPRDISALARAIMAFGPTAASYLAPLVSEGPSDSCFYALVIAAKVPHPTLVEPVARRVFDADPGVAQLALEVLSGLTHFPEFEVVLSGLTQLAEDSSQPLGQQYALRVMASLGDARVLPALLSVLTSAPKEVAAVAHEALVRLTCHDFGTRPGPWKAWSQRHGSAHRIEWLIDGLTQSDEHVRAMAGTELTRVTHLAFGFHPALPRRNRELVQRKYQDWWELRGREQWRPTRRPTS